MAVIDVRAVERYDVIELLFDGLSTGLDTESLENLDDIVRVGSNRIDVFSTQHLHEGRTVGFEDPLGVGLELALVRDLDPLLLLLDRLCHVDFGDRFDALKSHVREDVLLD